MPVDFLNDDQAAAYGGYVGEVEEAELQRYFFLDDEDRSHIDRRRRDSNRLGYAVQLCSVRALGRFLPDARDVPAGASAYTAARGGVNLEKIRRHWPDMLRIIGSIHAGTVRAHDVIRMLHRDGNHTALGDAIAHYGRIQKTLPILRLADDEAYRRLIGAQTNLHEGRHSLARKIFHGHRGRASPAVQGGAGRPDSVRSAWY